MLNGALDDVAKRNNISFADLPQALAQQGIDYRDFRDEIRRQLTLQLLRQRDVIGRINVSPRELEQFMARQQNAPDQNAEYNVSHILISVPVTASPEQIEAREQRAREVFDKAKGGEDFAQLAVTYSDSSTNIEGGSLGWRAGSQLPSIVAEPDREDEGRRGLRADPHAERLPLVPPERGARRRSSRRSSRRCTRVTSCCAPTSSRTTRRCNRSWATSASAS